MDKLLGTNRHRRETKHHTAAQTNRETLTAVQTHSQDLTKILCDASWDNKHALIAKVLLGASKEDVNSMSAGKFPLYLAARNNSKESVLELLNFEGILVDTQLSNGSTPAHAAAWFGHAEILALLLASGSSSLIKNEKGLTARDEAQGECKQVYKIYEASGPAGLKKNYPILEKLKTVVTRKSVPIRNKKTIVTRQVNFIGVLSVGIESTSHLDRCSQVFISIQVGEKRTTTSPASFAPTIQWGFQHQFDVNVTSNIPIRFAVHNQETGEAIANLDLPISIVAGEEFQKAMGPSLAKTFNFRTKHLEGKPGPRPEMKTILTFTPGAREPNRAVSKVFDLLQSFNQNDTASGSGSAFLVTSGAELQTMKGGNPNLNKSWTPARTGQTNRPSSPSPSLPARPEEPPKKFLVSVDHDDEVQTFVSYDSTDPFASGTFGSVFVGTVAGKGTVVAVKVITLRSEVDNQKLAKEVYIQFLFDATYCPYLLPLQMAFQTPNHFTLVMPFCKGGSLQDKLDKYQYIKEKIALSYAKQALLGIRYAF